MPSVRRERGSTPPGRPSTALTVVLVALAVLACDATPTITPLVSTAPSLPSGTPTAIPGSSTQGSPAVPSEPTQTNTQWGRIWDALPPAFPQPAGSTPAGPIGRGPSSGEVDVSAGPAIVSSFYVTALGRLGYLVLGVQGPLEDGSRVIDARGDAGCRLQMTVVPLGGVTHVTILFGASCPFR